MPAWGNFVLDLPYKAESALTKYRAVKQGAADDGVVPVTAATDDVIGVAQVSVSAGELALKKDAAVRVLGVSEMEAAAAITRGDIVTINATGLVKAGATGERVIGIALASASGANVRIPVLLTPAGHLHP